MIRNYCACHTGIIAADVLQYIDILKYIDTFISWRATQSKECMNAAPI